MKSFASLITLAIATTATAMLMTACFTIKASSSDSGQKSVTQTIVQRADIKDVHPWAGKRVAYLGDSVTDPAVQAAKIKYWEFLRDWLGITPYVYAVNGREWNDIPRQTGELQKEHGQDVDAIVIFIGTNDFNAAVPIGSFYSEKSESVEAAAGQPRKQYTRLHRTLVYDNSTLCGRINTAIAKIKETYPTKQLVLLTPIHRAYAEFGSNNVQPDENWQNSGGLWFSDYVETIVRAGRVWAVPVIDLNSRSGLYPMLDSNTKYFNNAQTDRLHPNAEGHRRIARTLEYQLLTLPCTFE